MSALLLALLFAANPVPAPAPVTEYTLHPDGGIVYDPLRREAEKTGQLARYGGAPAEMRVLELDGFRLEAAVPRAARAYDVVPIPYTLTLPEGAADRFPVAVEAVAFEEAGRAAGPCFDLALPGRIDLDVEFAGAVTAHLDPAARHNLKPDMSDTPKQYPPFTRGPVQQSGVVEAGDLVWMKFRFTNTGDTILDAEGYGGCLWFPQLLKKNEAGEYEVMGGAYNMYVRDLEYLYPGESHELWFHCASNWPGFAEPGSPEQNVSGTPQGYGMAPGEYLFRHRLMARRYVTDAPFLNIWEGPLVFQHDYPFTVEASPRQAPIAEGETTYTETSDQRTRFIHTFEEFMTAFDCHLEAPAEGRTLSGTLHLQVAPWTQQVVLRLIPGNPVAGVTAAAPVTVSMDHLDIRFDPDHQGVFVRDGLTWPVIGSQTMADMRTNIQIGPYPEEHIRERMAEMMDCGVNVVATTSMPWLYADFHGPVSNYQGDAMKYALDVARDLGMRVEGWGTYPFDRSPVEGVAEAISREDLGITNYTLGGTAISMAEPGLPKANAIAWLYQFHRWGDLYHQDGAGVVPISVEDTRGWMRQDVNIRYEMGTRTIEAFRDWLREHYGDIAGLNAAWGSDFPGFDAIDPEQGQVRNPFGHLWEYTDPNHPFHDWNAAVHDLDRFRTELRVRNYRDTLAIVREEIPTAAVCLRTEGGNVLVSGIDPADPNPHLRHVYYSQRRCGAIAEILQGSDTVAYHSDYVTMPYTPSELRVLVRRAVDQGIIPSWFPQFDNMRDIAINRRYGTPYQVHYNLPEPRQGYMMHGLTAVYPWFQSVYEEGGVPGILWEDLQCDGFVTETQKREMRLFKAKLEQALNTPEALEARRVDTPQDDAWRAGARARRSYE